MEMDCLGLIDIRRDKEKKKEKKRGRGSWEVVDGISNWWWRVVQNIFIVLRSYLRSEVSMTTRGLGKLRGRVRV